MYFARHVVFIIQVCHVYCSMCAVCIVQCVQCVLYRVSSMNFTSKSSIEKKILISNMI